MKRILGTVLVLATVAASAQQDAKPLPNVADLRARAISSYAKSEKDRERYICTERIENDELDAKGAVKKRNVRERELFYVNGFAISQDVSQDGKPLTPAEQHKRDDAVKAAINSATAHKKPKEEGLVLNAGDVIRMAKLTSERRILVAGRPTIVFDVASDKEAKADSVEQRIMRTMEGTISIDEATGNVQDISTHGVRDVKVGGGLVATIHKGTRMHMLAAPQGNEGVWLLVLAEGTGDARIALFKQQGIAFKQETRGCKVFDVNAETKPTSTGAP